MTASKAESFCRDLDGELAGKRRKSKRRKVAASSDRLELIRREAAELLRQALPDFNHNLDLRVDGDKVHVRFIVPLSTLEASQ